MSLSDLEQEEAVESSKAEEVREKKLRAEESKNMTIEDLTKGVINYKYLGLDFEKAETGRLRYEQTVINSGMPLVSSF